MGQHFYYVPMFPGYTVDQNNRKDSIIQYWPIKHHHHQHTNDNNKNNNSNNNNNNNNNNSIEKPIFEPMFFHQLKKRDPSVFSHAVHSQYSPYTSDVTSVCILPRLYQQQLTTTATTAYSIDTDNNNTPITVTNDTINNKKRVYAIHQQPSLLIKSKLIKSDYYQSFMKDIFETTDKVYSFHDINSKYI